MTLLELISEREKIAEEHSFHLRQAEERKHDLEAIERLIKRFSPPIAGSEEGEGTPGEASPSDKIGYGDFTRWADEARISFGDSVWTTKELFSRIQDHHPEFKLNEASLNPIVWKWKNAEVVGVKEPRKGSIPAKYVTL